MMGPAQLNAKWWKANKAKTLLNEPLTKALEQWDKCEARRKTTHQHHDAFGASRMALRLVEQAIGQTEKKCNPKIHKETMGYLKEMAKIVAVTRKAFDNYESHLRDWLNLLDQQVKAMETSFAAVKTQPSGINLMKYAETAERAHHLLLEQDAEYPRVSGYFGQDASQLANIAREHAAEAKGPLVQLSAKASQGDAKSQNKLAKVMFEYELSVKKAPQLMKSMRGMGQRH